MHPNPTPSVSIDDNPLAQSALWYASRNLRTVPLYGPTADGRCDCRKPDCKSPAKHPRTEHGLLDATLDRQKIIDWWTRWPRANIGIVTGRVSNLVVIDVDPRHGGTDTLERLLAEHGDYPPTREARTGGGGWHLYFTAPTEPIASGNGALGPGVDLKAEGGYVVAPPSIHISGGRYEWADPASEIVCAPLPDWVREVRARKASEANEPGWIAEVLADLREGTRNESLTKIAGWLRRYGATSADVVALLQPHAEDCGLTLDELFQIASHVGRYAPVAPSTPSVVRSHGGVAVE